MSGYPKGLDFGARVGMRTQAGRNDYLRYWNSAVDVPGPAVDRLGAVAKQHAVFLVIGVIERDGGTLYCTVLFFDPGGRLLGKHRKLMPTAAERLVWGLRRRLDDARLRDTPRPPGSGDLLGELHAADAPAHVLKGIQIYCAPTADERETWVSTMRHVALEGRCFVLSANQYTTRADYPTDYATVQGDDPATVISRGGELHRESVRAVAGGTQLRRARHSHRGSRHGRDPARQVRLRCRRPLCAA